MTIDESGWEEQKFECTDFGDGPPAAGTPGMYWVQSTPEKDPSTIYFEGPVEVPGGRFNATDPNNERVEANSFLKLFTLNDAGDGPAELLQEVIFHSSCSQQLYLLDVFGSFQLIEFESLGQGVIGFGIAPQVSFSITLGIDADPLTLQFLNVVILPDQAGLLPPQNFDPDVSGTRIPPPLALNTTISLIPDEDFSVITTLQADIDGIGGCFDISETIINCPATVEPVLDRSGGNFTDGFDV